MIRAMDDLDSAKSDWVVYDAKGGEGYGWQYDRRNESE